MKRTTSLCLAGLSCIVAVSLFQVPQLAARAPQVQPTGAPLDASQPRAILDKYCIGCHNAKLRMGGLSLDGLDLADGDQNAAILEKVARKLDRGEMPPNGRPRPDQVVSREIASSLTRALDAAAAAHPTPGRGATR